MVVRGGEDRERKSFPEAAGKKAPRVAGCDDPFNSLPYQLGSRWRDWRPTVCYRAKIVRGRADETMLVWMQGVVLESAARTKSAKSTKKTVGLDIGAAAAMPTGGEIGSADLCSCRFVGEIGSADFSMNMGWKMDCPGQAGKFVKGTR